MSPFLLLIALSVAVPRCLSKTSDQYSICAPFPFSCGDFSTNLSYPFSIDGTQTGCSHPGFHLSCTKDNLTQLIIYNTTYSVKNIDYDNQIMTIVNMNYIKKDFCPLPTSNTSLDFLLFDYTGTDRNVSYYYCSSQAVGVSSLYQLSCDASTGMYDYYFTVGDRVDESCTGLVYFIPIYASFMDSLNVTDAGKALMSLKEALKEGFDVTWKPGKGWCEGCVGSGGRCGYDPSKPNDPLCFYTLITNKSRERVRLVDGVVKGGWARKRIVRKGLGLRMKRERRLGEVEGARSALGSRSMQWGMVEVVS